VLSETRGACVTTFLFFLHGGELFVRGTNCREGRKKQLVSFSPVSHFLLLILKAALIRISTDAWHDRTHTVWLSSGILCKSLGGGVLLGHWNPYPILDHDQLDFATLCYAMLCYAMLCYAMLCYAMLCYAMLCYIILFRCSVLFYSQYCREFHVVNVWIN